jgi:hypothetical protein
MRYFYSLFFGMTLAAHSGVASTEVRSLDQTLSPYLSEFGLPALAAAVFGTAPLLRRGGGHPAFGQDIP